MWTGSEGKGECASGGRGEPASFHRWLFFIGQIKPHHLQYGNSPKLHLQFAVVDFVFGQMKAAFVRAELQIIDTL